MDVYLGGHLWCEAHNVTCKRSIRDIYQAHQPNSNMLSSKSIHDGLLAQIQAHFLTNLYLPPATSSSPSSTFSARNSCRSWSLQENPSVISIRIIIAS